MASLPIPKSSLTFRYLGNLENAVNNKSAKTGKYWIQLAVVHYDADGSLCTNRRLKAIIKE